MVKGKDGADYEIISADNAGYMCYSYRFRIRGLRRGRAATGIGKDRVHKPERQRIKGTFEGAALRHRRVRWAYSGFFRRVDHFNDSVKQEWLTDGFEEAELLYTKYDPYAMQDEWTAKNGTFPGYNCRITAMSLFGDFLSVSADSQINAGEDVLFVDEETLKTDPDALGGSSLADFRALYSSMKAEDTTEIKRHVQTVQEEWASRGVTFRENERIRLITVFFHDKPTEEESLLFVGHVGVLLTAEDGTLYFVEKVAFQEPYRMLRFADRTALSDYLIGKYDTSWGQDTASPFIMENNELMDVKSRHAK